MLEDNAKTATVVKLEFPDKTWRAGSVEGDTTARGSVSRRFQDCWSFWPNRFNKRNITLG